MAASIDIPLRRNEVWGRTFELCDASNNPYDLTGCTGQFQVRSRTDNATLVASGTLDFGNAAWGRVTALLRADEGTPLGEYGSPIQTENLPFDIRLRLPSGDPLTIAAGTVVLTRGVSHD